MLKFKTSKQGCFLWLLLSNNAGFPTAFCPTCSGSSSPGQKQLQHPHSAAFTLPSPSPKGWAGLATTGAVMGAELPAAGWPAGCGLLAGTCLSLQRGHHPHLLLSALLLNFPKKPHSFMQAVQAEGTVVSSDLHRGPELQYCSALRSTG